MIEAVKQITKSRCHLFSRLPGACRAGQPNAVLADVESALVPLKQVDFRPTAGISDSTTTKFLSEAATHWGLGATDLKLLKPLRYLTLAQSTSLLHMHAHTRARPEKSQERRLTSTP
ncbi:hypothetical protein HZ326_12043 [Fusarium oxysporum f. sp. albedinis]|nr:hypothetical protein HZ326_12043 [Fusarium oxysporum f. sp. albedinis]